MRFAASIRHVVIGLVALMVVGCASPSSAPTETAYQTLSISEFATILDEQPDAYTIVNVHIPYEGEVENTDAHIPYNDIDALTAGLPDKDAKIILYCRSGRMSQLAAEELSGLGYTQIWDVPGGMVAWEQAGMPLVQR